ncbi:DUF3833 domain-containing protein [Kordiimonas sp.]|uniref:DUF3833 domain-containing protein n=1 Tax=Kordiimonas sp. TaxID=1970157 RepID=UPI003A912473
MTWSKILLFFCTLTLSACGVSMKEEDFRATQPILVLEEYFKGETTAYGFFEDRFGNIRNQFKVDITGTWDGTTLILDENFIYNDGSTEFRRWDITKTGENTYTGTTENAIGEASGRTSGNSFHWKYKFNLNVGDSIWKVKFDDWMFLQGQENLLNKATVYRWGLKIGTVFIAFNKTEEDFVPQPHETASPQN